jgi:phosphoglycolate phosphatase-like HAD superfamily hydrolase
VEKTLHLIMFDIDGTLVNSYKFDEACYIKASKIVLGVEISSNWKTYTYATDIGILNENIDRFDIKGDKNQTQQAFKQVFLNLIKEQITNHPENVQEVKGASRFIQYLFHQENVKVAIATGGFEETAKLKLKAAGIDINGCAFASSGDHYSRTGIMKVAEKKALITEPLTSKTYFGDAVWDREASKSLNYQFVLVGNRTKHNFRINDYQDQTKVLSLLNL